MNRMRETGCSALGCYRGIICKIHSVSFYYCCKDIEYIYYNNKIGTNIVITNYKGEYSGSEAGM